MYKLITFLSILFVSSYIFSQSKKEQINFMQNSIDSLENHIQNLNKNHKLTLDIETTKFDYLKSIDDILIKCVN